MRGGDGRAEATARASQSRPQKHRCFSPWCQGVLGKPLSLRGSGLLVQVHRVSNGSRHSGSTRQRPRGRAQPQSPFPASAQGSSADDPLPQQVIRQSPKSGGFVYTGPTRGRSQQVAVQYAGREESRPRIDPPDGPCQGGGRSHV